MPSNVTSPAPICLREMGSFHVGGRQVQLSGRESYQRVMSEGGEPIRLNPNGTYVVEQMYVQYFLPQQSNGKGPLVLWHGGGMTGAAWETTPDGREGWVNHFVRQGWDTYVCDAVERGRSGFAPYPDIWPEGPVVQTADDIYARFRIGEGPGSYDCDPARRSAYADTRFPVKHFDTLHRQMVPRWTHTHPAMLQAFHALLARLGSVSIICHSQAGPLAMRLAAEAQGAVRALACVEPAGTPALAGHSYHTPTLIVLGGNISSDARWRALSAKLADFSAAHPAVDLLRLEDAGIHGNSHLLMMDDNSNEIAARLSAWLQARV